MSDFLFLDPKVESIKLEMNLLTDESPEHTMKYSFISLIASIALATQVVATPTTGTTLEARACVNPPTYHCTLCCSVLPLVLLLNVLPMGSYYRRWSIRSSIMSTP